MPSVRQIRTLAVGVLIGVVLILVYTSRLGSHPAHGGLDFWDRTVSGLDKHQQPLPYNGAKDKDGDGNIDADDELLAKEMADRLKAAEEQAKEAANKKAPRPDAPSKVVGQGNAAAHQEPDKADAIKADADKPRDVVKDDTTDTAAAERQAVEAELNTILRKSPVIIFSKSYCPFSKRAKALLLEKYDIRPAPFVVELDEHTLGKQLQTYLGDKTDRTTVPNILVNGVSIGGSDDIADLEKASKLVAKVVDLGAGKVTMRKRLKV